MSFPQLFPGDDAANLRLLANLLVQIIISRPSLPATIIMIVAGELLRRHFLRSRLLNMMYVTRLHWFQKEAA